MQTFRFPYSHFLIRIIFLGVRLALIACVRSFFAPYCCVPGPLALHCYVPPLYHSGKLKSCLPTTITQLLNIFVASFSTAAEKA